MSKTKELINKIDSISEAGKDFSTYKKNSTSKNPVNFDLEVHAEGMKAMGDTSRFSKPEKNAISNWSSPSGYKEMNGHLRGTSTSSSAKKHIENLDSAMDKTSMPEEVNSYRGFHGPHATNFSKLKAGDTFYNKGYTATTVDPNRSTHYARDGGSIMHVTVPKGHKAVYVSHPDLNDHTSERELLLPHNTHFKYHSSEKVKVPEHHYDGTPTGSHKTLTVHHVSVLPEAHDMSEQLDKV